MAVTSLLALIDDIAFILDDVAAMTKVAARKTAGVLGDDLALNAQQVAGVDASRELPVVWAVAKGSMLNKVILVPIALLLSAVAPWAVTPLLMVGGAFLCYEGAEKLAHKFLHQDEERAEHAKHAQALAQPPEQAVSLEQDKIKGAVRTDFILSAEIIAISLGVVATMPMATRAAVLGLVAVLMTVGVYGLVAGIVKLDDAGLALSRRQGSGARALGRALLTGAPWLMKALSVGGTIAMFLVGGGILTHGIGPVHHLIEGVSAKAGGAGSIVGAVLEGLVGIVAGVIVLAVVSGVKRAVGRGSKQVEKGA